MRLSPLWIIIVLASNPLMCVPPTLLRKRLHPTKKNPDTCITLKKGKGGLPRWQAWSPHDCVSSPPFPSPSKKTWPRRFRNILHLDHVIQTDKTLTQELHTDSSQPQINPFNELFTRQFDDIESFSKRLSEVWDAVDEKHQDAEGKHKKFVWMLS